MKRNYVAARVALLGLLFALAAVLSVLEGWLPVPMPVPGVKLGLSNITVMYCLFMLGAGPAFTLAAAKSLFVLLIRGPVAASLSACGGGVSIAVMLLLLRARGDKASCALVSMGGAVGHNTGQLALAALLLGTGRVLLYYLPVLVASGLVTGMLTALLFKALQPYFKQIDICRPVITDKTDRV